MRTVLLQIIAVFVASCASTNHATTGDCRLTSDEITVLQAALAAVAGDPPQAVLTDITSPYELSLPYMHQHGMDVAVETIAAYSAINNDPCRMVQEGSDLPLVSSERLQRHFRLRGRFAGAGWPAFRRKYPSRKSVVAMSRPGFNSSRTEALVHVDISCGVLCGNGEYVLLRKRESTWVVIRALISWEA